MTTLLNQPLSSDDPKARRWSKSEYHEMADLGWFRNQRAELIEGEIVVLSPQKFEHGQIVDRTAEVLRKRLDDEFWVRMQLPLDLGTSSEPEPDVSVVRGRREDFHDHPTDAILVIEISDSTIAYDRREKASLYARAGIADYWVFVVAKRQLYVHRDPAPDGSAAHGFGYRSVITLQGSQTANLLAESRVVIAADDLIR